MPLPNWLKIRDGYGGRSYENISEVERFVIDNAAIAKVVAKSSDPHADYSYDDFALIEIDEYYCVFETSGCSCPDPSDTWGLVWMGTRNQLSAKISEKWKDSYSSSGWIAFQQEVAKIWPEVTAPKQGKRYDW